MSVSALRAIDFSSSNVAGGSVADGAGTKTADMAQ